MAERPLVSKGDLERRPKQLGSLYLISAKSRGLEMRFDSKEFKIFPMRYKGQPVRMKLRYGESRTCHLPGGG